MSVPRFDLKQADAVPLMSSLIGTAVPTNNRGKLPEYYLNVSEVRFVSFFSFTFYEEFIELNEKKKLQFLYNSKESHWFQEYLCKSVHQNTIQIANQFKHLQNEYKKGFLFKDFHHLPENELLPIEYKIQSAIKSKLYTKAVIIVFV